MTTPDVTVFIPTYNRAGFLEQCLTALIDQGLPTEEYVVSICDNCCEDDTPQVVDSFRDRLQIDYHRRESTVGSLENINGVNEFVKTPYVSVMCDDDLLAPGQLGRAMTCLRAHPEASLYGALGVGWAHFGDPGANLLGAFLAPEPVEGDPFLFRWTPQSWLANCSLRTPMTILGSVFRLADIPQKPMFGTDHPQEGDRLLFLSMVEAGEIYSAPWIGGYMLQHAGQQTTRNENVIEESLWVTTQVLKKAEELGHDLVTYWVERLPEADPKQLELICSQINRTYPPERATEILEKAGVYKRWRELRKARRQAKKDALPRQGFMSRVFGGLFSG